MNLDECLKLEVERHPYALVFATISGVHLYGFPSPDSDFDLRGCHVLPVREVIGLNPGRETIDSTHMDEGREIDLVTHDARKFFGLMLKKNGYVLEQLFSPLIVVTSEAHEELKEIGRACVTRYHSYHYLGFAATQRRLFEKEDPPRIKPLLYLYRVLLTGIHLVQTGRVEANLERLNEEARLSHVSDLIAQKRSAAEKSALDSTELAFHRAEIDRLETVLREAQTSSTLPENSGDASVRLNDLLIRLRMRTLESR